MRFSKHCWQCPILVKLQGKARISRPEVFCQKDVLENFTNRRCFPVSFVKFSRTPFFHRTPPVAASEKVKAEAVVWRCSVKKMFLEISLNTQENICARVSILQP